eukprot:gnl/TRDRNA2_/TRDRNA2_172274_c0_seq5.p1 gnl/TRDRNA2_/TRDRNA2_172274_c0~~gnl/TRDRNA2_/TRDRNA2_172274_c0_seq5.p1  ORF type:complete len:579 (+),score=96.94 gnl/TRDRNA2_/TRDRNA2_172274_c0_seq5:84-1820(+)
MSADVQTQLMAEIAELRQKTTQMADQQRQHDFLLVNAPWKRLETVVTALEMRLLRVEEAISAGTASSSRLGQQQQVNISIQVPPGYAQSGYDKPTPTTTDASTMLPKESPRESVSNDPSDVVVLEEPKGEVHATTWKDFASPTKSDRSIGAVATEADLKEVKSLLNSDMLQFQDQLKNEHELMKKKFAEDTEAHHARLQILEEQVIGSESDAAVKGGEAVMTFEHVREKFLSSSTNSLESSVWDAALFIGVDIVGTGSSLMTAVALSINVVCQIFFCIMATDPMIRDMRVNQKDVKKWRETVAHSRPWHDPMMRASMVSRVCSDDGSLNVATMQTDAVHDILLYNEKLFGTDSPAVGLLLCTFVLIVWYLTLSVEIVRVYRNFVAYAHIPKTKQITHFVHIGEEGIALKSVSWARFIFVYFVLTMRIVIALVLLRSGAVWLCRTFSVPDLVLNAAALAFILEIDELLFATLVPQGAMNLVRNLDPLRVGKPWMWRGLGCRSVSTVICGFLFVIIMVQTELLPFHNKLDKIMGYMCDGNTDFIFERMANGSVVFEPTTRYGVVADTQVFEAVQAYIHSS